MFNLQRQVEDERRHKENADDRRLRPDIDEWLSRRKKKRSSLSSKGDLKTEEESEEGQTERDVIQQLLSIPDLPPSLLPPPPGGWRVKVETEWG